MIFLEIRLYIIPLLKLQLETNRYTYYLHNNLEVLTRGDENYHYSEISN